MTHVYLGPEFSNADCLAALERVADRVSYRKLDNPPGDAAALLAAGHPVAWFQGRMEFGPRALGARSILVVVRAFPVLPTVSTTRSSIASVGGHSARAVLDRVAPEMVGTKHPAPFMTITFDVVPEWPATGSRGGARRRHGADSGG